MKQTVLISILFVFLILSNVIAEKEFTVTEYNSQQTKIAAEENALRGGHDIKVIFSIIFIAFCAFFYKEIIAIVIGK